eukprot:CAMPEP_0184675192 /NCGR_PEP_ID=MMETSP0308-20130426/87655_1 /TAXON_ID=38269 /ORGANISM="Gloeochaete witrockiana, Strain SAG 46.84" /LENGTH=124 /DNA_ID=CAMNT_0027122875 /DNA_START=164 /DNA_END=538 /DNA_ORIENTATION=+
MARNFTCQYVYFPNDTHHVTRNESPNAQHPPITDLHVHSSTAYLPFGQNVFLTIVHVRCLDTYLHAFVLTSSQWPYVTLAVSDYFFLTDRGLNFDHSTRNASAVSVVQFVSGLEYLDSRPQFIL